MLNWTAIGAAALWVTGLATLLAVASWCDWQARGAHATWRATFVASRAQQVLTAAGLALTTLGAVLSFVIS